MQRVNQGHVHSHHWELFRGGAAPFTLYLDGSFYCTCDSLREVDEELDALESKS